MLDGGVTGRGSNPQRADVVHRDGHVDGNSEASDARVDGQARASLRGQELDVGIECPTTKLTARATVHRDVSTALRQDRRESFRNGCHSTAECIEVGDRWLAFSTPALRKRTSPFTLAGETPQSVVWLNTKANRPQSRESLAEAVDRFRDASPIPEQILSIDALDP